MDRFERLAGALRRIPGLEVRENEPMKRHTTFRIGGPARLNFIKEVQAANRKANHNCFAYLVGDQDQVQRESDNGEPSGTAAQLNSPLYR